MTTALDLCLLGVLFAQQTVPSAGNPIFSSVLPSTGFFGWYGTPNTTESITEHSPTAEHSPTKKHGKSQSGVEWLSKEHVVF
jgi:hypothetical protein